MRRLQLALCLLWLGTLGACGSSSGESGDAQQTSDVEQPPEKTELPQVTKQSSLTVDEFLGVVNADTTLAGLWNQLKGQGATTFLQAGISKDEDGVEVNWGEVSEGDSNSGLLRLCTTAPCTGGALYSISKGQLSLKDKDGKAVTMGGIGLPILLKQLAGHTYDKPTEVIKQGLELPSQLPNIDVSKRHAYLVSAFGDLWAAGELSLDSIETLLKGTSAFDTVTKLEYAQVADLDDALLHAHPFDVLVWLGQTVREEVKTNQIFMPVGLTVNAGVFGDKLYDRDRLEDVLALNPLQGPGVMVLAGCESMDDGNGGGLQEKSLPKLLDNGARVVVGFVECGDARDILYASEMFLEAFIDQQKSLGDSLAQVNTWLESLGGTLRMATLPEFNLETVFLKDTGAFWDQYTDAGIPGESFLTIFINVVNRCTKPDGTVYQEDESFATAWTKNITWQGPFFSGARTNPDNNVDITITGALTTLGDGAHFFFTLQGDLGPKVNNLTLYGNADVQKIVVDKEKPEEFVIQFNGQGVGSEYTNALGDTCIMQNPYLSTTTGEPSTFVIPVPWKETEIVGSKAYSGGPLEVGMQVLEGKLTAQGMRVAIIVSRFNSFVTERLLEGAVDALTRHDCDQGNITVIRTPGAFEIPTITRMAVDSGKYDAVICLGAVIRGGTPHFDYVAAEVSKGVAHVALGAKIPVTFGVLTCDNLEQAIDRAGAKSGNKGVEATMAAVELHNLMKQF